MVIKQKSMMWLSAVDNMHNILFGVKATKCDIKFITNRVLGHDF